MKEDEERLRMEILSLNSPSFIKKSKDAKARGWYGNRLSIIRHFYQKSGNEIAEVLNINTAKLSKFETNIEIPSDDILEKLSFIFEVPKEFFTKSIIRLSIKDQHKIIVNKLGGNTTNHTHLRNHGK